MVKEISLAYVPEACVGQYVIVHVGLAISVLDEQAANLALAEFRSAGLGDFTVPADDGDALTEVSKPSEGS